MTNQKLSIETISEIRRMRGEGTKIGDVRTALGVSISAITKYQRAGVEAESDGRAARWKRGHVRLLVRQLLDAPKMTERPERPRPPRPRRAVGGGMETEGLTWAQRENSRRILNGLAAGVEVISTTRAAEPTDAELLAQYVCRGGATRKAIAAATAGVTWKDIRAATKSGSWTEFGTEGDWRVDADAAFQG